MPKFNTSNQPLKKVFFRKGFIDNFRRMELPSTDGSKFYGHYICAHRVNAFLYKDNPYLHIPESLLGSPIYFLFSSYPFLSSSPVFFEVNSFFHDGKFLLSYENRGRAAHPAHPEGKKLLCWNDLSNDVSKVFPRKVGYRKRVHCSILLESMLDSVVSCILQHPSYSLVACVD